MSHPIYLLSSNVNKLKEFARMGLANVTLKPGIDLPEVQDSNPQVVALYKSALAGAHTLIEDTSLHVQGADIGTNVRWQLDSLGALEGAPVTFTVLLAFNDGTCVHLYEGHMHGTICLPKSIAQDAFGFDPFVRPNGTPFNLYELEKMGQKDQYSARKIAVNNFLAQKSIHSTRLDSLAPWQGSYQDQEPSKGSKLRR